MRPTNAVFALVLAALGALPARAGVFPRSPFTKSAAGTTGANFLKLPASARATALGSSYVAAVGDSEAMFFNPGGLARMQGGGVSDASMSYNALLETSYASTLSYARPFSDERGVLGLSVVYFSQSSLQGYSALGDPEGKFKPYDMALSGAYARKTGPVGLGGALKVIRSKVGDASGTAFAVDFGVQAERVTDVGEGALDLGMSLRNMGPAIRTGDVSDPLPFKLQMGALWHVSPHLRGLLDGHIPVDESPYVSLGAEWAYPVADDARLALRGGYDVRNDRDIDGLTGFTAGFGLGLGGFRMDYAWVPLGDLGMTHRISLGFAF